MNATRPIAIVTQVQLAATAATRVEIASTIVAKMGTDVSTSSAVWSTQRKTLCWSREQRLGLGWTAGRGDEVKSRYVSQSVGTGTRVYSAALRRSCGH